MLRILDANLNRIGEGLRLLEDVARFVLNDGDLSLELKTWRHQLLPREWSLQTQLLSARGAGDDVAAFADIASEGERDNIAALVSANAKRVQQSLRLVEEWGKLKDLNVALDWHRFKEARFALYDLEQRLVLRLLRRDRVQQITGLYVVIDTGALGGRNEMDITRQVIQGGARVVQLRAKDREKRGLARVCQEMSGLCAEFDVLFIVDDHVDLALASDADGVHLGQDDLPVSAGRAILSPDRVIGLSTHTLEQALGAAADGADYVALGSIYPTSSKPNAEVAGLETLRQVKEAVSVPVVAIGGINEGNVAEVMDCGADAVAVISAVLGANEVGVATRRLVDRIEEQLSRRPS